MSATDTDLSPKAAGILTRLVAKAIKGLSPAEQKEMLQDASLSAGIDGIGKAKDELFRDREDGGIDVVSDQWDGPPDDGVEVRRVSGGDSGGSTGGRVDVGKPQAASGDGAQRMSDTYSRPTPQVGVQATTERLGRQIAGVRAAMKSLLTVVEAQNTQLELLKSTVAGLLDVKPVAKAEEEKEEKKEEETAKAKDDGIEVEIEEGSDDKEEEKAAARVRFQAKSHLRTARAALVKAAESEKEEEKKEHEEEARKAFEKARSLTEAAKALNPRSVIKLPVLERAVAEFAKALPKDEAENQDKWPEGKPAAAKAQTAEPSQADIAKAMEKIDAAVKGFGMLQADVSTLLGVMGGQSRSQTGLPPVFELAKSNPDAFGAKGDEIENLVAAGTITRDEADRSHDVLMQVKAAADGRIDQTIVQSRINRLPVAARQVFGMAA